MKEGSLHDIKDLLNHFNPSLTTKHIFRNESGGTDMHLQLECDYRFSRAIKKRLKRQCFTPFAYFTAPKSRFSPPHITMIYPSYALQRHNNYLKSR